MWALGLGAAFAVAYAVAFAHPLLLRLQSLSYRLFVVAPLSIICCAAPLAVPEKMVLMRGFLCWLVAWLMSFKCLALALGTGSLVGETNICKFLVKWIFPVLTPDSFSTAASSSVVRETAMAAAVKFVAALYSSCLLLPLFYAYAVSRVWQPPEMIKLLIECAFLWALEELALSLLAFVAIVVFRVDVQPGMRMPVLSVTLKEFWSRRWNLPVSHVLRDVCYIPLLGPRPKDAPPTADSSTVNDQVMTRQTGARLRAGRAAANGTDARAERTLTSEGPGSGSKSAARPHRQRWRALAGSCAAFGVSGIVHECIVAVLGGTATRGRASRSLKMFWFFAVQPFLIAAQEAVLALCTAVGAGSPLTSMLGVASSWVLMLGSVYFLFRPPMYEAKEGLVEMMLKEHAIVASYLLPQRVLNWPVGVLW